MAFFRRFRYWLTWRKREAELTEEIELHRSMAEQDFTHSGYSREAAIQASRRALGNVLLARENARGVWIWPWTRH